MKTKIWIKKFYDYDVNKIIFESMKFVIWN